MLRGTGYRRIGNLCKRDPQERGHIITANLPRRSIAIVTGASGGIGGAISLSLAALKWKLVLQGRSLDKLEQLAHTCDASGAETHVVRCDLTEPSATRLVVEEAVRFFGGVDVIINNAGVAIAGGISAMTESDWDTVMTVNARAPYFLIKTALPYLKASDSAYVINISSVTGEVGYAHQSIYSASKHALMGLTKALSEELREFGVTIHAISPGGVDTPMIRRVRPDIPEEDLISPNDVAETVVFLLTRSGTSVVDEVKIRRSTGKSRFS